MSDLMLKTAVAAKVRVSGWKNTTVDAVRRRAGDRGQTAVEYLGIIAVVVAIVLAITGTSIGQSIYDAITQKISEVTGG
ncbi:Flp family type IVb pilin [Streptomyces sp. NPDC007971]|uniref:Flp family type IVb pilin n=1 Tax=Streptomyces sp. NPDC007971 TaxID=3364799 RepID=UPI0036E0C430